MAADYTTGSASSLADLRTAVENFLTAFGGWTAAAGTGNNRLLSKGGMYVRIGYDANRFYVFGGTGISGTALTGESPRGACLGNATASQPWTFPVNYEIYWNDTPEEIYIVVNYNGDKYQHLHWGKSDISDIGGAGLWFEGSYATTTSLTGADDARMYMTSARDGQGGGYVYSTPYRGVWGGFFMGGENGSWTRGGGIHCGLEGAAAWRLGNSSTPNAGDLRGQHQSWPLMMALPSMFNESEVLLPIYITMRRTDSVDTIVGVLRHARMMRLDNVAVGDIITYGSDQWKCYPLYSKNTVDRNGRAWGTPGAFHSGTVGVALRYPGA